MKIATGGQISVAELKAITGLEDKDIYLSILEAPLYLSKDSKSEILPVTVEMITQDNDGRLRGAVRGKDPSGVEVFENVWFDTKAKVWKIDELMNDMIHYIEEHKSAGDGGHS